MRFLSDSLAQLIAACAVPSMPADILQAIIMTESSGYVYALSGSYDYSDYYLLPETADEAEYSIAVAQASLHHQVNISVGLMQVNSWHLARMGMSVATAMDPCNNVLIGSSIFKEIFERVCVEGMDSECLDQSLRQYNTGKTQASSAGDAYVRKVRKHLL